MTSLEQKHLEVRSRLNKVSPSFCLAKWSQVTLHLHSGQNHSCHHPATHKTPLQELKNNPSALHNTKFKKQQRKKMLEGTRPEECDYCWNIEDLGENYLSDRTLKSSEEWAIDGLEEIAALDPTKDVNPRYVEVSFSSTCNFRCSYCSANFSSRWKEDLRRHGPYVTRSGEQTMESFDEESNPYIQAFWKWWPDLVQDLRVFRITGGEPLLSKNTFQVLEDLIQNPRPELELAINTNLGISGATFERFLQLAKKIVGEKKIKSLQLYTSAEAWEKKAEYIRDGLNFERFQKNLERILQEIPDAKVFIMATYNALSVTSFKKFLEYIYSLKVRYTNTKLNHFGPTIDISYLRNPQYQSVQILPIEYHAFIEECLQFMQERDSQNFKIAGFNFHEVTKMKRTLEWAKKGLPPRQALVDRERFYSFFKEHDERRNTSFLDTFPEMSKFWYSCRNVHFTLASVVRNESHQIVEFLNNIKVLKDYCVDEILIVDNSSTDNTRELIEDWCQKNQDVPVKLLPLNTNYMATARNTLLREARTEWIYFLDADCRIKDQSVLVKVKDLMGDSKVAAIGGGNYTPLQNTFVSRGLSVLTKNWLGHMGSIQAKVPTQVHQIPLLSTCSLVVNKYQALKSGGFNEAFSKAGEDLSLSYNLTQNDNEIWASPDMTVEHLQDRGLKLWLGKMYRYGEAQLLAAIEYPQHFKGIRGLQFAALIVATVIMFAAVKVFIGILIGYYLLLVATSWKIQISFRHKLEGAAFIFLSQMFYGLGELSAVFTLLPKVLLTLPKRMPVREKT